MIRPGKRQVLGRWLCRISLVLWLSFWCAPEAGAGVLADRVTTFPHWQDRAPVSLVQPGTDLIYPDWLAGTWQVESPLVDLVAPFAPEIVTPGFAAQQARLYQAVHFSVRFQPQILKTLPLNLQPQIVADRAFNGQAIAEAYLGPGAIAAVQVNPRDPNRQITRLRPQGQIVSQVTARGTEEPEPDRFIATEIVQQIVRQGSQIYSNTVETTTDYQRRDRDHIDAEQFTAVYLSPQDPQYFQVRDRPVALYHYQLELRRRAIDDNEPMTNH